MTASLDIMRRTNLNISLILIKRAPHIMISVFTKTEKLNHAMIIIHNLGRKINLLLRRGYGWKHFLNNSLKLSIGL